MFDYFNKPALDDAINAGKEIRFHIIQRHMVNVHEMGMGLFARKNGYFALEKKEIFGMQQNNFNDIRSIRVKK